MGPSTTWDKTSTKIPPNIRTINFVCECGNKSKMWETAPQSNNYACRCACHA